MGALGRTTRDRLNTVPIRTASDQGDIHAFALNAAQWTELKATYHGLNLRMPCCGVAAIPKTSVRGNFFFAHARKGECTTADESPVHLYCKSLIARAALDAGWSVTTERPGVSPTGEEWVADVFCERGTAQLALEVQMSPQSDAETVRRQQRYKASGVRGAWFFGARARTGTFVFDRETPAFSMRPVVVGELPTLEHFAVSLPDFVRGMLQKRLLWTIPRYSRPHYVEFIEDVCWACKKPVRQTLEHLHGDQVPAGEFLTLDTFYEGRWDLPPYTEASLSKLLEATHAIVTNEELAAQGLNLIGRRHAINSKPTRFPYCNLCLQCRAPQNNHFLIKTLQAAQRGQASDADDLPLAEAFGAPEGEVSASVEPKAFGLAVIPREIEGGGLWMLQQPSGFDKP